MSGLVRLLALCAALGLTAPAAAEPSARAESYLNEVLDVLEARHINSASADWPTLRAQATEAAGDATQPHETYSAIRQTITALGERHTFLRPAPDSPQGLQLSQRAAARTAAGRPDNQLPRLEMAEERYPLLWLPQLMTTTPEQRAFGERYEATLSGFLSEPSVSSACGLIVDLRENGGGNMWPMLNGLAPVLGRGPFGAFARHEGPRVRWLRVGGRIATGPAGTPVAEPDLPPVAVLVGPRTASSGEMVAIAFVGRDNARLFGQPTANFTTANTTVPLSDGAVLALTTSKVENRLGVRYDGPVQPDEVTAVEDADEAAIRWLDQRCPPRAA